MLSNDAVELIVNRPIPSYSERSSDSSPAGEEVRGRSVYQTLAIHQRQEAWSRREIMTLLQAWAARFISEFKLEIPEVALCLDLLSSREYGHFRYGHNGFGLRGEIALNTRYLPPHREFWEVLGTLLHELLHAWQQAHGTPGKRNHHNREFRDKARSLGLKIDSQGITSFSAEGPFRELLQEHGISLPAGEILPVEVLGTGHGSSKLKKWSCGCTNVRVAVPHFRALCLNCNQEFRPAEQTESVRNTSFNGDEVEATTVPVSLTKHDRFTRLLPDENS